MKIPAPLPYFSTDAGGAPMSATRTLGAVPGVPPLALPGMTEFVGMLSTAGIGPVGTFTPWGELEPISGAQATVRSIPPPDVNLVLFDVMQVQPILQSLGIGSVPFLVMLSTAPLPNEAVRASLTNTPYELFDNGIACYRQDDLTGVPKMFFLYWIHERNPGDTAAGRSSPELSARSLGATLNFAQQVDATTTTQRGVPVPTVEEAASVQFPMVFAAPFAGPTGPVPVGPLPPPPGVPGEVVAFANCVSTWLGIPGAMADPMGALASVNAALGQCAAGLDITSYVAQAQSNPIAASQALMADAKAACPSLPDPVNCFGGASMPEEPLPGTPPLEPFETPLEPLPDGTSPSTTAETGGPSAPIAIGIGLLSAFGTFMAFKRRRKRG